MAADEGLRKLTAILAADVAGYSRLMADDERATVRTLTEYREIFSEHVTGHQGRIVDTAGDSVLATFDSVVEAVEAAVEIQRALGVRNEALDEHRRMHFRIGVNLGDIIIRDDGTIYGDGVNVAARLEALAAPGGVMLSEDAYRQVRSKMAVGFKDAGAHDVKNIAEPVRAYRVLLDGAQAETVADTGEASKTPRRPKLVAGLAAGLAILIGLATWGLTVRIDAPQMVKADGTPTDDPLLAMPTGPTVAVLPFDNLGNDAEQDYFAIGLTEDIVSALSRFGELRVTEGAATSADYALEGSVRRAGDALRVAARLKDMRDGTQMWSEQFDRDLSAGAVFDIQDTITVAVATAIGGYNGAIARQRLAEATGQRTEDLAAYECVLLVYVNYDRVLSMENFTQARECLEAVLERDPTYVDALAALSYVYGDGYSMGLARDIKDVDPIARSFELASRAVELNPNSATAHRALALAYFYRQDTVGFAEHASRALSLNPHAPQTLGQIGSYFVFMGEGLRGVELLQKAFALNPDLPDWYNLAFALERQAVSDYENALIYARKVKDPYNPNGFLNRVMILAELGRLDEARSDRESFDALWPGYTVETSNQELRYWNYPPEAIERTASSLRKAGFPETPSEAPARPVIAVLPFDNMSGDPEQDYFADGITEDIITNLSLFDGIDVIGRNSSFQYKGSAVDIRKVGEDLSARYVLEGSVRRDGNSLRVTAQLLDAQDGSHVWSNRFDRSLDVGAIFEIQDQITTEIAGTLGGGFGVIAEAGLVEVLRKPPETLASYECVLLAQRYFRLLSPEAHLSARDCLEKAVVREPGYPDAWAWLAHLHADTYSIGFNPVPNALERAENALEKALALSPRNQKARWVLAFYRFFKRDIDGFVQAIDQALEINPNNTEAMADLGAFLAFANHDDKARMLANEAQRLDPTTSYMVQITYYVMHYRERRYQEALSELIKMPTPDFYWYQAHLAAAYGQLGEAQKAHEALAALLALHPEFVANVWQELDFWFFADDDPIVPIYIEGLRKAGMEVPEQTN